MSSNIENRNIFKEINKDIINKCKTVEEIYENIPFASENEKQYNCETSRGISSLGYLGRGGMVPNIFNQINKKSKNTSNIEISNGEWEQNLKSKSIDELIKYINFNKFSIHLYLNNIKQYSNLTWDNISRKSNHKIKYLEGIFSIKNQKSRRSPSRDCIIGLSFAFDLNIIETNYLLNASGYNELYLRNKRDLIITKSLLENRDINYVNHYLIKYNEKKIGNRDDNEG